MPPIAGHHLALYAQLQARGWAVSDIAALHECYKLAATISFRLVRANWKPFVAHLVGAASITAWDSDNAALIRAALVHSALEFGVFPRGVGTKSEKLAFVSARTGAEAAALVGRYNDVRRVPLLKATAEDARTDPSLMRLRLANALDDLLDEFSAVRTEKVIPEMSEGATGFRTLANLSEAASAPALAGAFRELSTAPQATVAIAEKRRASFRLDQFGKSGVQLLLQRLFRGR